MMWGGVRACTAVYRWAATGRAAAAMPTLGLRQARHPQQCIHTGSNLFQRKVGKPSTSSVKVLYVPNPLRWLHNRMELATLKAKWDPSFDLQAFKFGAIQAICTVTDLMSQREWGELCGLLTQSAIDKLRSTKWTYDQTHNLVMCPDNVQSAVIKDVRMHTIVDEKYCDIEVLLIGAREPYNVDKHSLILIEYLARFNRNFGEGRLPDWTITMFRLHNFQAVPQRSRT
ncbi:uncharacterized protein LOC126998145 [Eriocheir sinensis]|uniref:uncharacterized protein LOC126998145 n=1 Tax=Eriocheir sinensis TaxID=95602 RepID=UPI0021C881DB|nr:uncharacterized protein LOC126998145 [Eriocheir sinensis]XP_050715527.1 uncharacterized protein LOC126998145 [Eriocheir sinensis]